jgi:hypothetical protein
MTKFLNNADVTGYISQTSVTSSLLKTDSAGKLIAAVAGTDYNAPDVTSVAGTLIREIRNATGATLTKGTVVYISGATGNKPTVSKALATGDSTSAQTFGLCQTDIANNSNGNVVCVGDITGLDTSAFTEGVQLYLSSTTAGTYTTTKQLAPAHLVYVGVVTRSHPTQGQIEVKIQNGYELDEIHDVAISSLANNQGLFYESATDLWKNKTIETVLGGTPVTGSGTSGQVTFWNGTNSVTGSTNFTYSDSTPQLNIGSSYLRGDGLVELFLANGTSGANLISAQRSRLQLRINSTSNALSLESTANLAGSVFTSARGYISSNTLAFYGAANDGSRIGMYRPQSSGYFATNTHDLIGWEYVDANNAGTNLWVTNNQVKVKALSVTNSGNVLIGSTTDNGIKLQVTGQGYFSDSVGIGSSSLTGITLNIAKNLTGATASTQVFSQPVIQSDVTGTAVIYNAFPSTQAAAFTLGNLYYYQANQSTIGASSAVTTQIGFRVASSLTGATNNFAFRSELAAAANTWNLYMNGTANNYMAGSLGIGSTNLTGYSLRSEKGITGAVNSYGIRQDGTVQSDVTSIAYGYSNTLRTQAATFTLTNYYHYDAGQAATLGAGSTVTNQVGFWAQNSLIGATNNFGFRGDIPAATGRWNLYMNGTADNYLAGSLGIGSTSLTGFNLRVSKNITGATSSYGISSEGTIQSDVTYQTRGYSTFIGSAASAFTLEYLYHYYAAQSTIGAGSAVTNQHGFSVDSGLTGATNNYGFFGNLAAGTGRWNIYMAGTADNYMAGSLGIGSTSLTGFNLRVNKGILGATTSYGISSEGVIQSTVTVGAAYYSTSARTIASTFTLGNLYHYVANQSTIGAGSTVTNQYGFFVTNTLVGATNNYGFYGSIAASSSRWNIYMAGTAQNYLAGALSIGVTTANASALLQVDSTTQGFLPPRMTAAQRTAISTPAEGLVVFQTDGTIGLYVYANATWRTLAMV